MSQSKGHDQQITSSHLEHVNDLYLFIIALTYVHEQNPHALHALSIDWALSIGVANKMVLIVTLMD